MVPFADGLLWLVCCAGLGAPAGTPAPDSALRTFVVEKPPVPAEVDPSDLVRLARGNAVAPASAGGRLQTTIGVGYVQRAGWGAESIVGGTVGPLHLQAESLFTFGVQGPLFDHGTILLKHINQPWLAEAGDLFSELRGPATGLRVSWQVTDRWMVYLGLRNEQFKNINGDGATYVKQRHQLAPRIGATWDVFGDSTFKIYANAGRYHLAIP